MLSFSLIADFIIELFFNFFAINYHVNIGQETSVD